MTQAKIIAGMARLCITQSIQTFPATYTKPYDQALRIVSDLEGAGFIIREKASRKLKRLASKD